MCVCVLRGKIMRAAGTKAHETHSEGDESRLWWRPGYGGAFTDSSWPSFTEEASKKRLPSVYASLSTLLAAWR